MYSIVSDFSTLFENFSRTDILKNRCGGMLSYILQHLLLLVVVVNHEQVGTESFSATWSVSIDISQFPLHVGLVKLRHSLV